MNYNSKFVAMLTKKLDSPLLNEVKEYGYCHHEEEFCVDGVIITLGVYELDHTTYLIKYVGDECVIFRDITARPRN